MVWLSCSQICLTAGSLSLVHCSKFVFSRKYWLLSHYYWMIMNLSRIPCLQSWMPAWGRWSVIHVLCCWSRLCKASSLPQMYSSPCSFCRSPEFLYSWFSSSWLETGNLLYSYGVHCKPFSFFLKLVLKDQFISQFAAFIEQFILLCAG